MKILIVGCGYVGISLASLLSKKNSVLCLDTDEEKLKLIESGVSPINDTLVTRYLKNKNLKLKVTSNKKDAYLKTDFAIICTPTNYNSKTGEFDTSTVESIIKDTVKYKKKMPIFIKSTVPVGFTEKMKKKYNKRNIYFSPEFLREGQALYDNLYPSRIIVGGKDKDAKKFGNLLLNNSKKQKSKIPLMFMSSTEAEAVKLFANTYLAMRISFFNELDSFCELNEINTKNIIMGIGHDERIGTFYNNPSFGYGGYCLPKDTQQLLKNYEKVPNKIIKAIVEANTTRKNFISDQIINKKPKVVGVFRLVMKQDSDNFRESAVQDIMKKVKSKGIKVIIYEPSLEKEYFYGSKVYNNMKQFFADCDLIIANRNSDHLKNVQRKIYTRDIFNEN